MTLGSGNVPNPSLVRFGEDRNQAALPFAQEAIMDGEAHSPHRSDVYQSITTCIIEAIEAGAGEFHMPWHSHGSAITKPENALTRMDYHGVNVLALWAQAYQHHYQSGYWASYRQWKELGAQVRKGEKGSVIVFFKKLHPDDENEEEASQPRLQR
jgi:antirestriction protein ArdC